MDKQSTRDMIQGRALPLRGDDIDTDRIIPARYLNVSTPEALAAYCMEDIDPDFASAVRPGDMIVGGENFGCGSSREHAPLAIKGAGVSRVVACSFALIFYRNAINVGLPILICPEVLESVKAGAVVEVDLRKGLLKDLTIDAQFQAERKRAFLGY